MVGARGRSGLGSALLGSVSAELSVRAPCPVAVVPPEARLPQLRPGDGRPAVVCGVVGTDEARAAAIVAGELAEALDATLLLVYSRLASAALCGHKPVATRDRELGAARRARAARGAATAGPRRPLERPPAGARQACAPRSATRAERIEAVARRADAALTFVGCRGRGPLRTAVHGSTSRALATRARRPIVVAKRASLPLLADAPPATPSGLPRRGPDRRRGAARPPDAARADRGRARWSSPPPAVAALVSRVERRASRVRASESCQLAVEALDIVEAASQEPW